MNDSDLLKLLERHFDSVLDRKAYIGFENNQVSIYPVIIDFELEKAMFTALLKHEGKIRAFILDATEAAFTGRTEISEIKYE